MASAPNKRKNIHKSQVYISVWFQLIAKNNSLNFGGAFTTTIVQSHTTSAARRFLFIFAFWSHSHFQLKLIFCIKSRFFINWYFVSSRDFLSIDILYEVEIFYQLIFCIKSRFFINWYFVSSRESIFWIDYFFFKVSSTEFRFKYLVKSIRY